MHTYKTSMNVLTLSELNLHKRKMHISYLELITFQISLASTSVKSDVKEVFRARSGDDSIDIWELATHVDKDVPDDIWEIVGKSQQFILILTYLKSHC